MTTTICRHGETGFCWDDATSAEREAFDFLHRHAYAWAEVAGRDTAEEYAAHYAAAHFADPDEGPNHTREFERWLASRG